MEHPIRRIILVPGLLEPRIALWPLKRVLQKRCERVECFPDRIAFRKLDDSVDRLADMLHEGDQEGSIGIVTHSFGDWVARQAIARTPEHRVTALVSVAPAMRAGLFLYGLHLLSGNLIPEVAVIMDAGKASANLDCDDHVRRLVIWAKADECVLSIDLDHIRRIQVLRVLATHLSVILQPNVWKLIENNLFPDDGN
jgi:pimeloyl-ACP methyl ester carboxylesterase